MANEFIVFDNEGNRYVVENIHEMKAMTRELPSNELEDVFKSTIYFKHFEKHMVGLVEKGELKALPHGDLNFDDVDAALKIMGEYIIKTQGQAVHDEWQEFANDAWNTQLNGTD